MICMRVPTKAVKSDNPTALEMAIKKQRAKMMREKIWEARGKDRIASLKYVVL